ncbi:MAG: hypothetical protein AMXMBFR77_20310 [Phycisphaerales bacterium]|nr:MAG: hypothetical protein BroJett004_18610 [Planctomycetota bacterium]
MPLGEFEFALGERRGFPEATRDDGGGAGADAPNTLEFARRGVEGTLGRAEGFEEACNEDWAEARRHGETKEVEKPG